MPGIDEYTKLMLHMNDAGLSDSSVNDYATTLMGATTRSAVYSKFGEYSAYFPGSTNSYLSVVDSDDWNFGAGDFTIDFWIKSDGGFGDNGLFGTSQGGGGQTKMGCYLDSISSGYLTIHRNGTTSFNISWAWSPADNTEYHVAIVRNGSSWYLFVNGVQTGGTQTQSQGFQDVSSDLRIGTDGEGWKAFKGWIDEFRISKGIARWVSNFTLPTEEYSQNQVMMADASLDLSAYGRALENLQAFLRAHDRVELHDLQATLEAFSLSTEDFSTLLIAALESTEDFTVNFETWATQYKDLAGDFDVKGQSIESLMSRFETAKAKYKNLAAVLSVTDGSVLKDLAAFLSVTDGSALANLGLYLKAVQSVPAFRSIIAQRVSSVVHEVS